MSGVVIGSEQDEPPGHSQAGPVRSAKWSARNGASALLDVTAGEFVQMTVVAGLDRGQKVELRLVCRSRDRPVLRTEAWKHGRSSAAKWEPRDTPPLHRQAHCQPPK